MPGRFDMPVRPTDPLREEHRELLPHIEAFRTIADSVGEAAGDDLQRSVEEAHKFLTHHLIPHAVAEDRVMYPAVEQLMGAPGATATMSRDHVEVVALTRELGTLSRDDHKALRRTLYGLYALVSVHFAKEEEIYVPLLDEKLTPDQAAELFKRMEAAAGEAREERTA
jgi:iron-sulfur cluster repair protein YtfE (RIC family)